MLNVSIVLFIIYSLGCFVIGINSGDYYLAWFQIPCLMSLVIAILLTSKGFHTASITIVLSILIVAFSCQQFFYGGDAQLHIWLFVPIMGTCLAYPPRHSALAFIMGGIAIVALTSLEFLDVPAKVISPLLDSPIGKANNMFALGLAILGVAFVSRSLLLAAEAELRTQRELSEKLLNNTLPMPIAQRLKDSEETIADSFENCSVLFCDIVGFTKLSENFAATELVQMLNEMFTIFDELCEQFGVEKIKTIGDAYMVVAGIPKPVKNHALILTRFAQAMLEKEKIIQEHFNEAIEIRIGIHSGPVIAGVIGKSKFSYDLWGDTVNVAARMESHGVSSRIQISEATRELIGNDIACEARGSIEIKGKGKMNTFLIY